MAFLIDNDGFIPADDDGFVPETGRDLAPTLPVQPDADGFVEEEGVFATARRMGVTPSNVLAATFRYGIPVAGALGAGFASGGNPAVGVLAGGALASTGEAAAQFVERAAGKRPEGISEREIASAGLIGAIPFGRFTQAGRAARYAQGTTNRLAAAGTGALEGAGLGAASEAIKAGVEEGRLPTPQELGTGALGGAVIGGVLGRATERRRAPVNVQASQALDEQLQKQVPEGLKYTGEEEILRDLAHAISKDPNSETTIVPARAVIRDALDRTIQIPGIHQFLEQTDAAKGGLAPAYQLLEVTRRARLIPEELVDRLQLFGSSPELAPAYGGGILHEFAKAAGKLKQVPFEGSVVPTAARESGTGLLGMFRKGENLRRALMVQQLGTTVVNTISNAGRYTLDSADSVLERLLQGGEAKRVLGDIGKTVGRRAASPVTRTAKATIDNLIKEIPEYKDFFARVPLASESVVNNWVTKVARVANLGLGDIQERAFRKWSAYADIADSLQRAGHSNVDEIMADLPKWVAADPTIKATVEGGLVQALENTFAAPPQGELAKGFAAAFQRFPLLTTILPFPRFVTNAMKFVTDFNPVGVFKLLASTKDGELLASNPRAVEQVLSRVALGTGLLGAALAARHSEAAGDRWHEFRLPDGQVVDAQFLAPLSSFLFMAEAIKQMAETGSTNRMTSEDFLKGALSLNRVGGLGAFAFDFLQGGSNVNGMRGQLEKAAGDYLSGFTVPFQTFKDFIALADPEENIQRDTREAPLIGPALGNVPFATRGFPKRHDPLTGEVRQSGGPPINIAGYDVSPEAFRQVTGTRVSRRDPVESEIIQLGRQPFEFTPKLEAQIPEARAVQRRAEQVKGELTHEAVAELVLSPEYQALPEAEQAAQLFPLLQRIQQMAARTARNEMLGEDPLYREKVRVAKQGGKLPRSPRELALLERSRELLGMGSR